MPLRSEADLVRTLEGTLTLTDIYELASQHVPTERDAGDDVIHGATDTRWKRRVRCALQAAKAAGRAKRTGPGEWEFASWVVDGTVEHPRRALLVLLDGEPSHLELVLADAGQLLGEGEFDLIVADPPWALDRQSANESRRDRGERLYERSNEHVLDGYVDVDPSEYAEFTERWINAAAAALRPGAYLAAITGTQQAARVQIEAENAGLTFVNQVISRRAFSVRTTRTFSHAHTVITILCAGRLDSDRRFFAVPDDLPKARNGADYPLDVWTDVPKYERRNLLRYDNALPPLLVRRLVHALTPGPENGGEPWQAAVADPFLGSGTTAVICYEERRRFLGGDLNPQSLRFTMGRLLDEHVHPAERSPALFA